MFWLKSTTTCPPGEFYFRQTEGIALTFQPNPSIKELADQVASFRNANGLPGANTSQAYQDIVRFTCERLKNDPQWCIDLDAQPADLMPPSPGTGCGTCGVLTKP